MALPIMAHLVLGYPSLAESLRTAETYIAAGCAILELQIPFSHPTADGPVITAACREAVAGGTTMADCLDAVRTLREKYPMQEIMVMSYLNRIFVYGVERFSRDLAEMGIRHIIVPDLPALPSRLKYGTSSPPRGRRDCPQFTHPSQFGMPKVDRGQAPLPLGGEPVPYFSREDGAGAVPVIAANISDQRLDQLLAAGHDFFYLMSDFKITGGRFSLHPRVREMARRIKSNDNDKRIGIGFGINTAAQVEAVLEVADYAIIGSALIRAQQEGNLKSYLENLARPATAAP